jgi:NADH dehydrogenase FAD-containing subunit
MCRQACPRALISDHFFDQSKIFVSIPEQFEQYPKENFLFVQGAVTAVDLDARTAFISTPSDDSSNDDNVSVTETVAFHSLVVATGASTPSPLFGFNSGNRDSLRASWEAFRKALPNAKKIVIAGGGPAGIETAAELGEYLNGRPGFFSKGSQNVDITVVCGAERILPALRPSLANKAERMLAKLGVTVLKSIRVCSLEPAG